MSKKGSKKFRDKRGGQSEYSEGYQKDLEEDLAEQQKISNEKEEVLKKIYKGSASTYHNHSTQDYEAYEKRRQEDLVEQAEQARKCKAREDLIKEQTKKLESGSTEGMKIITVSSFYEQGQKLMGEDPKLAVKLHWKAFACGQKEAAYELYKVFHDGAGGTIRKNEEAAEIFVSVGKKMGEARCMALCKKSVFTAKEIAIGTYCKASARDYQGKVTEEIIKFRLGRVDQELNIDELVNAPVEVVGEDSHCMVM